MIPYEYNKYINNYLTIIEKARKKYGCDTVESCKAAKEAAKDYMSKYKNNVLKRQDLNKSTVKSE